MNDDPAAIRTIAIVFVCRSSQPALLHDHLPTLTATASSDPLVTEPVRLIGLPKTAEARLCKALELPRVGFLAIDDGAPQARPLLDFVRNNVPPVELAAFRDAEKATYIPVQINVSETTAPVASKIGKASG